MRRTLVSFIFFAACMSFARAETLVERGGYLVNAVMACDLCHTPRGPSGLVMEKRFSGGPQTWDEPTFKVKGSNITPDPETGIGKWTDAQLKGALTDGIRPDGTPIAPIMPFAFYKVMPPRDLDAVVAYMRTIPAVRNEVPTPSYKAQMPTISIPGGDKPLTKSALRRPLKRGFYLTTIAHCMECHTHDANGLHDFKRNLGKGGYVFKGPWGSAVTPNITAHKTAGIGAWTDADIKRALTQGVRRDGTPFHPPMARANYFSRMTKRDLDDLTLYVRSLPPLQ